ncbi:MAG: hypothetical protein DK302_000418, partial [Chloroflexi bacterium]
LALSANRLNIVAKSLTKVKPSLVKTNG